MLPPNLGSARARFSVVFTVALFLLLLLSWRRPDRPGKLNKTFLDLKNNNRNEVELVVSSVIKTNTSWIHEHLPDYPANIYVADDPHAPLTVPKNKGHESTIYLT